MKERKHFGRDLWERMCSFVDQPDELPVTLLGPWTLKKLFFLCQYLAQTTQAMVGHRKFTAVNYVDLFCGSGVCSFEKDGRTSRYPGSALLAAGCAKPFSNLFLVEKDEAHLRAVESRVRKLDPSRPVRTWCADANEVVEEVARAIPDRSLTVAFVDPYSLDVHFDTIRVLAQSRPLDLLILFADRIDLERNVKTYYYPRASPKLDLFLGEQSNWRKKWESLLNHDDGRIRQMFAEIYLAQLKTLGYNYARTLPIESDRGPLYRLVFASKSELGLKFWDIAASEDLGGNRTLWGVP